MPDPYIKKQAKMNQYKKSVKDYKKENFRKAEEKKLTKYVGTTGDPSKDKTETKKQTVTPKQKEEFRKQEETYLTKSPGTVGDKYYKNPEGTGTGQGGSGIPVEKTPSYSDVVTSSQPPVSTHKTFSDSYDDSSPTISVIEPEPVPISGLTSEDFAVYESNLPFGTLINSGDQVPLLLSAFKKVNKGLKVKPKFSLDPKGTFFRGIDFKYTF